MRARDDQAGGRLLPRRQVLLGLAALATGCAVPSGGGPAAAPSPAAPAPPPPVVPDPAAVARLATVPVLCWHQVRDWTGDDDDTARRFLVTPPAAFRAQLDTLTDAGWTAVTPDAYVDHLLGAAALPDRAVLLTFDDGQRNQVTDALPELARRGMTATFFVTTREIGKPWWLGEDDVRRLADEGMTVGAHTRDHTSAEEWSGDDWRRQLDEPRELLSRLSGQPVRHFAYPFGAWTAEAFPHLDAAGYATAFQLSDEPVDARRPLLTLRRRLVESDWVGERLLEALTA